MRPAAPTVTVLVLDEPQPEPQPAAARVAIATTTTIPRIAGTVQDGPRARLEFTREALAIKCERRIDADATQSSTGSTPHPPLCLVVPFNTKGGWSGTSTCAIISLWFVNE